MPSEPGNGLTRQGSRGCDSAPRKAGLASREQDGRQHWAVWGNLSMMSKHSSQTYT